MEKKIDIQDRYSHELNDIVYIIQRLENGRYYEKTNAQCDGYLATNLQELKEKLNDLIYKIEYDRKSINEEIGEAVRKHPI